ncbi:phytoene/squalene synthase family protein [Rhizobium oryzicola]|uniref:Phytoene/squalene synthase family protein n=1 Tax=Rhizobium oryzicola TaxID=1232668 RepID=A0ABT8T2X8_9HYPH|nr:phytoene/squalene synthase family protein [Rhizobium oryzicola]MDO1585114.1 phytoene/squalene synthase family protein [Rhizobium oryzicola]
MPGDHWDICLSTLRETDRERYLACLLSPADKRGALAALYCFNAEIARVRDVVHQPLAGEIRLQWWRDVLEGTGEGDSSANPVAAALIETVQTYQLPRKTLLDMIEARLFDLYDDPMPDRNAFEGYAGETASALIQLAGLILDAPAAMKASEIAGHAGVAQAIAGALLLLPLHMRRGQIYIPLDILRATGLDRESFLSGEDKGKIANAINAFAGLGLDHLASARKVGSLPAPLVPAFLPSASVRATLQQASRPGVVVERASRLLPQWRRQLNMLRMTLRKAI